MKQAIAMICITLYAASMSFLVIGSCGFYMEKTKDITFGFWMPFGCVIVATFSWSYFQYALFGYDKFPNKKEKKITNRKEKIRKFRIVK